MRVGFGVAEWLAAAVPQPAASAASSASPAPARVVNDTTCPFDLW
jgi:hypothetical protein